MNRIVIAGTDTDIGKTVFAAGLTQALGATYWKPVQAGLEEETDTERVARLSGQPTLPEAARLKMPASPHISAEAEGTTIDATTLTPPTTDGPLVIEGAGGLLVPINRETLYIDVFARWQIPVILCARTQLGTINHSLLSLQALHAANCPIAGIAFIGEAEPEVEQTIIDFGQTTHLGRLPVLREITPDTLRDAFTNIDLATIKEAMS